MLRELWTADGAADRMPTVTQPRAAQPPMVGAVEQVLEAVAAHAEIGVSKLVLSISTDDVGRIRPGPGAI